MTKADFIDWKHHPVTEHVFAQIKERIRSLEQELGQSAGIDLRQDSIKVGAIQAHLDTLDIQYGEDESD